MKDTYTPPVCELIVFDNEDVITTSPVHTATNGKNVDLPTFGKFD